MTTYWVTIGVVSLLLLFAQQANMAKVNSVGGRVSLAPSASIWYGLAAAVLALVAGLRWGVGEDFFGYVRNYALYKETVREDLASFNEPGVRVLAWIASKIHDDAATFILLASLVSVGLMLWAIIKNSNAMALSILLFVFVGVWHGTFNGIRQFLAAAIILAGHRLITDRKLIRYLLIVVLAASFHVSAFAMAALFFVPNRKLKPAMILLIIGGAIAALYATDYILDLIQLVKDDPDIAYTEYARRQISPFRVAVAGVPMLLYWTKNVSTEEDGDWFYRNMAVVHFGVMIAAFSSAYIARFSLYSMVFLPLVLPRLIDFPNRRLTSIVRAAAVVLFAVFWYIEVSGSSALNPFAFVFSRR